MEKLHALWQSPQEEHRFLEWCSRTRNHQFKPIHVHYPDISHAWFTKNFILECDASSTGLGVVLTQKRRPFAFISKQLSDYNLGNPTYGKEMMANIHVVDTWWWYLLGRRFQIKTYHHSLICFLEYRLSSLEQHKRVTKMLGYDLRSYIKGKNDVVANALSKQYEDVGSLLVLSITCPWLVW